MPNSNIKDLYEERGQKLKEKEKKAQSNAEKQLRDFYQNNQHESSFFQSPEMRTKYLQFQIRGYIDSSKLQPFIYKKPKLFGKKDYYQSMAVDFLSFCLNWTRLEGKPIILTESLIEEFEKNFPQWKESQYNDFSHILDIFIESGLCTGNNIDGWWFEPQNDSKDLQLLFTQVDTKGRFYRSKLKEKLNWSDKKVSHIVGLLEEQQIIIPDTENEDLYWLLEKIS